MRLTDRTGLRRMSVFLALLLVFPLIGHPQDLSLPGFGYSAPIDTVVISGNSSTREYVILNEMSLKPGVVPTFEAIQYDRGRIYSLGLFTRVDLLLDTLGSKQALRVVVSERWHYFPVPLVGFHDGDPSRGYYGIGFQHNNFQGRNQKLFGSLVFGYNPSAHLSFYEPLIDAARRLSFSAGASFSRVRNRSEAEASITGDFEELHYDLAVGIGKRLSLFESLQLSLAYQVIEISSYRPSRTVSPTGIDRFFTLGVGYANDTRDLGEYASRGKYIGLTAYRYGLGTSEVSFTRFNADLRTYIPLGAAFTLAGRLTGSVVAGDAVPSYAHTYFGYGERIRGYFKTTLEGEDLLGSSVELRYSLLPLRVFRLAGTFLPDEFTVWQFGISLAIFADAGTTWFRHEPLTLAGVLSGYGAGIRFLLPYGFVARTEYAINNQRRGEFILDLRAPF